MDFLPITLNVKERDCLVVGGGQVAARKVNLLHSAGAKITVVSPELCQSLSDRHQRGEIDWQQREVNEADIQQAMLIIAATDDEAVNQQVAQHAHQHNIPVNVVDQPGLCSFYMPSIVDRSPVIVSVSTGGASPVLARLLRSRLETFIPTHYGQLATMADEYRTRVKQTFSQITQRRRFWENVLDGSVAELALSGKESEARELLETSLAEGKESISDQGEVYLVGAGPGDPDLLTFRALRLMQRADVVLYDRLVSKEILAMVRRDADLVYVGKHRAQHAMQQEDINATLVKYAKQGKRVLRLKGGDPFIFGRGGEEIDTLAAEGIGFQVVPGITAASGCASYAGIPLTHRDYAQSVTFVTGQLKDGTVDLNWPALIQPNQTVVIYMGLVGLELICQKLIEHGQSTDMPIALVEQGTTANQRVFTGTLGTLPDQVKNEKIKPPTLIIVGEVVTLQDRLAWYKA